MNSRAPEMAIYLRVYLRASFHLSSIIALYARAPHSFMNKSGTSNKSNLFGQADSHWHNEASGPLTNGRIPKMYS